MKLVTTLIILPLALISTQLSSSHAWSNAAFHTHHITPVKSHPCQAKLPSRSNNAHIRNYRHLFLSNDSSDAPSATNSESQQQTTKLTLQKATTLLSTFWSMAYPYYRESQAGRTLFLGMIVLTLMNSGVSVAFSYISKDFWNALSSKDSAEFYSMMVKFGGALVVGAPVAVLYR